MDKFLEEGGREGTRVERADVKMGDDVINKRKGYVSLFDKAAKFGLINSKANSPT